MLFIVYSLFSIHPSLEFELYLFTELHSKIKWTSFQCLEYGKERKDNCGRYSAFDQA